MRQTFEQDLKPMRRVVPCSRIIRTVHRSKSPKKMPAMCVHYSQPDDFDRDAPAAAASPLLLHRDWNVAFMMSNTSLSE